MSFATFLLPLTGALIASVLNERKILAAVFTVFISACTGYAGFVLFKETVLDEKAIKFVLLSWLDMENLKVSWELAFNRLSGTLIAAVLFLLFPINIFSIGFIKKFSPFFSLIFLFVFVFVLLLLSANLLQFFVLWQITAIISFVITRFNSNSLFHTNSALKSFVAGIIPDVFMLLGLFAVYKVFGTFDFDGLTKSFETVDKSMGFEVFNRSYNAIDITAVLLLLGCIGIMCAIVFHTWYIKAMVGETPASILVHTVCMPCTAVFFIVRMYPLFMMSDIAVAVMVVIGVVTALYGAVNACFQLHIKRVMAYSNISQYGLVLIVLGAGNADAALFVFIVHSFIKTLIFMGCGSVIYAMSDELDLRKMGGMLKHLKITFTCMWAGCFVMMGLPFFVGFYAVPQIAGAAYSVNSYVLFAVYGVFFFTAVYLCRMMFMIFNGEQRGEEKVIALIARPPALIIVSMLLMLAVICCASFYLYDNAVIEGFEKSPVWVGMLPLLFSVAGIFISYAVYKKENYAAKEEKGFFFNGWYIDSLLDRLFAVPLETVSVFLRQSLEENIFHKLPLTVLNSSTDFFAGKTALVHSGRISSYALGVITGITAYIVWLIARAL